MNDNLLLILPFFGSLLSLTFAFIFYKSMQSHQKGDERMEEIASIVRKGAFAYLKEQYKSVGIFFVFVFIILFILSYFFKLQSLWTPFAFLTGGFFSGLAGFIGMNTATQASSRTAQAAKKSLDEALKVAFRAGAVMGLTVVGLGLLDITVWFFILRLFYQNDLYIITSTILTFGMGASSQALFARVGGGIFTKAADVGADIVGKIESEIPEDDARNPAVIADNVGDNVGDVAGMGADLYESYCGSILSAASLGAAVAIPLSSSTTLSLKLVILPLLIAAIGILSSIIGIFFVKTKEHADQIHLMQSLNKGINISTLLIFILSFILMWILFRESSIKYLNFWLSLITGLLVGIFIGRITEIYTSFSYKPTKFVADQTKTGTATVILAGLGESMISTGYVVLIIVIGIIVSYLFSSNFDFKNVTLGLYGIALSAVGMLSTLGITLSTDAYGPVADNAGGNAQMSKLDEKVRERTDALDSLGNTTAATGKGFAIGSAALTALAFIAAFSEAIRAALIRIAQNSNGFVDIGNRFLSLAEIKSMDIVDVLLAYDVHLMNVKVIVGVMIGSMLPFVFSGLTLNAVGRSATKMVDEIRRQFHTIPGILEGKNKPDYERCVSIAAKAAEKEMIVPALIAVIAPIFVGITIGVPGVFGLLAGSLGSGFVLAIMMANAGGSWDNAKKYIESGELGGKGSENHKSAVVGDTVGDPLKDTAGPSLNILIKLMSIVSIVTAGLMVFFHIF